MPHITDIYAALQAITGKFELESEGELRGADNVRRDIVRGAIGDVFAGDYANADLRQVTEWLDLGGNLQVDDTLAADELISRARDVQGLRELAFESGIDRKTPPPVVASAIDFVLEGLSHRRRSAAPRSSSISPPNRPAARARAAFRPRRASSGRIRTSEGRESPTTEAISNFQRPISKAPPKCQLPRQSRTFQGAFAERGASPRTWIPELAWELGIGSALALGTLEVGSCNRNRNEDIAAPNSTPRTSSSLNIWRELLSKLFRICCCGAGSTIPTGFHYDDQEGVSADALHDAILEALLNERMPAVRTRNAGEELSAEELADGETMRRKEFGAAGAAESWRSCSVGLPDGPPNMRSDGAEGDQPGHGGRGPESNIRFEITDKSLDFLGYRALRDLLGSIGPQQVVGRHDTREIAGTRRRGQRRAEAGTSPATPMNLDASRTES